MIPLLWCKLWIFYHFLNWTITTTISRYVGLHLWWEIGRAIYMAGSYLLFSILCWTNTVNIWSWQSRWKVLSHETVLPIGGSSIDVISPVSEAGACTKRPTVSSLLFLFIDFDHSIIWGKIYPMILEHELKSHETSFDNPGLFSNFTYVKMKGPNKQLSNQLHYST